MNIFYSVNESGCAWWRCRQPAAMIERLGLAKVQAFSTYTTGRAEVEGIIQWADTIVSQSPAGIKAVNLAVGYQQIGKTVIVDYDDLVFSCSPFNPAYDTLGLKNVKVMHKGKWKYLWHDPTFCDDAEHGKPCQEPPTPRFSLKDNYFRFRSQQDLLNIVDGITVTTDYLKTAYAKYIPEQKEKIFVLPNSIDFDLFKPFLYGRHEKLRLGWTVSDSHLVEIWMMKKIMREVLDKHKGKVKWVILGNVEPLVGSFSSEELEVHPFVDLSVYPLKFASLELDIGVSPLKDEEFNRCKSPLKWSEYSALGIPTVVSNLAPYSCVEHNVTGLVASDEADFVAKLSVLIENPKLRKDIASNAYEKNYAEFNLKKNAKLWVECYKECRRKKGKL